MKSLIFFLAGDKTPPILHFDIDHYSFPRAVLREEYGRGRHTCGSRTSS